MLRPEDFHDTTYRLVYETMRELTEVGAGTPMGPILFEAGNFLHAS